MENRTEDSGRYERAKARVDALRQFYVHAGTFAVIIGLLIIVDALTGDGWWLYWAALGWGTGLIWHALAVFGPQRHFGANWEQRKIQQEMERDTRR